MPLKKGNTNIGAIYKGTTQIAKIYKGTKLLFENAKWLDYLFEHIYYDLIPITIDNKTVKDKARLTKISGNGVVENQLVNLDTTVPSGTTGKLSGNRSDITTDLTNHKITVTSIGDTINYFGFGVTYLSRLQGHKVLCLAKVVNVSLASSTYAAISFGWCLENLIANHPATPSDPNIYHIGTFRSNISTNYLNIEGLSPTPTSGDYIEISNPQMIDLTLMFGPGNEPTTLNDNRIQALLNRGYIPYNTGSYKNSRVGEIETFNTDNQLLDTITLPGLLELNGAINSHSAFEITNTDYVFTRNIGIRAYQSGDESLANVLTDLTNTYYPLVTPQVITIPKKHLGCVDLGSLNWTSSSSYGAYSSGLSTLAKKPNNNNTIPNIYCSLYTTSYRSNYTNNDRKLITIDQSGDINIEDSDLIGLTNAQIQEKLAGQYLFYETDSEVSDFDNVAQINADGSITSNSEVLPNVNFEIKCK